MQYLGNLLEIDGTNWTVWTRPMKSMTCNAGQWDRRLDRLDHTHAGSGEGTWQTVAIAGASRPRLFDL